MRGPRVPATAALTRLRRWTHLASPARAILWWLATRALLIATWALVVSTSGGGGGDVIYYYRKIRLLMTGTSPASVLDEYPTPVVWLLCLPYWFSGGESIAGFVTAFFLMMLALDAVLAVLLWRGARRTGVDPSPSVLFWVLFVPAIGVLTYFRLDLLPSFFSACSILLLARRRPSGAGALIGVGAALKLWPALLWPATLLDRRSGWRATTGFIATGAVLAVAALLYAGWGRLISPLTWQSDRGLQIESVWATPLMLARLVVPGAYSKAYDHLLAVSAYQAYEISGPGSTVLLHASTVATVLGGLVIAGLYLAWHSRTTGEKTLADAATLMVIVTLVMIVTDKTFSPQYVIWLGGPVAAMLTLPWRALPGDPPGRSSAPPRFVVALAAWVIGIAAVTQLIFPALYASLVRYRFGTFVATFLLAARNVAVVWLLVWLTSRMIRRLRTRPPAARDGTPV